MIIWTYQILRIFKNRKFLSFPYLINLNEILNKIKGNKKSFISGICLPLKKLRES